MCGSGRRNGDCDGSGLPCPSPASRIEIKREETYRLLIGEMPILRPARWLKSAQTSSRQSIRPFVSLISLSLGYVVLYN